MENIGPLPVAAIDSGPTTYKQINNNNNEE